jgi:hypothetical protein
MHYAVKRLNRRSAGEDMGINHLGGHPEGLRDLIRYAFDLHLALI